MYIVYIYIYVCKKKKKNTQGRVKNTGQHLFIPIYVHWPEESSGWTPVLCNTDCCLMGTLRPKTVILLIADTLYCEDGGLWAVCLSLLLPHSWVIFKLDLLVWSSPVLVFSPTCVHQCLWALLLLPGTCMCLNNSLQLLYNSVIFYRSKVRF